MIMVDLWWIYVCLWFMMDDCKQACLLIGFLFNFQNEDLQKPSPDTNFTTPGISEPISEEPGAWVVLGMSWESSRWNFHPFKDDLTY